MDTGTGATPLEEVRAATRMLRAEIADGSVSTKLRDVRTLVERIGEVVEQARGPHDQREAFAALGDASILHADVAGDAMLGREMHDAAIVAQNAARAARDPDLEAVALIRQAACKVGHFGDHEGAIRVTQRAVRATDTGSILAAAFCRMAGAYTGKGTESPGPELRKTAAYYTLNAIERAHTALESDTHSPYIFFDASDLANWSGIIHSRVGDTETGIKELEAALGRFGHRSNQRLHCMTDVAEAYMHAGEPEQATEAAWQVYEQASHAISPFKLKRLKEKVVLPLRESYMGIPRLWELRREMEHVG